PPPPRPTPRGDLGDRRSRRFHVLGVDEGAKELAPDLLQGEAEHPRECRAAVHDLAIAVDLADADRGLPNDDLTVDRGLLPLLKSPGELADLVGTSTVRDPHLSAAGDVVGGRGQALSHAYAAVKGAGRTDCQQRARQHRPYPQR